MGWDATRPVPWRRLLKEWVIYGAVMTAVLLLFFRRDNLIALIAGVAVSGPIYLALGAVLAKFGYQRRSLAELRTPRAVTSTSAPTAAPDAARPRPAPTKRTSTGPNRARKRR